MSASDLKGLAAREALPPQPPPQPGRGDVLADLLEHPYLAHTLDIARMMGGRRDLDSPLKYAMCIAVDLSMRLGVDLRDVIRQRREKGIETYHQPLQYGDGRALGDALEEAVDLAAYLLRAIGEAEGK